MNVLRHILFGLPLFLLPSSGTQHIAVCAGCMVSLQSLSHFPAYMTKLILPLLQDSDTAPLHTPHLLLRSLYIGVNRPAIVREIPHFGLFPAFPHFCQNVPHFWLYFEIKKIAENRNHFSSTETFCSKKLCENVSDSITYLLQLPLIKTYVKNR